MLPGHLFLPSLSGGVWLHDGSKAVLSVLYGPSPSMGVPAFLVSPQTDSLVVWQGLTLASNSEI